MKKLLLIALVVASSALLAACSSGANGDVAAASGEIEVVGSTSHDWGEFNIMGGDVEKMFTFKNVGEDDLLVKTATTSCMCTTAEVILPSGEKSPKFGMRNNAMWNELVAPGEEFEVSVVYDPLAHGPTATGPIMRSVNLETSDGAVELTVQGNVLSEEEFNQRS